MSELLKTEENLKKESLSDLVIEKMEQGNFAEAANISGHFFASVVLDELENGKRIWIDSFNNHLTTIMMAMGMIQDLNPEQIKKYNETCEKIQTITTRIKNELSNKEKVDADENDKRDLMGLVQEMRKITHL